MLDLSLDKDLQNERNTGRVQRVQYAPLKRLKLGRFYKHTEHLLSNPDPDKQTKSLSRSRLKILNISRVSDFFGLKNILTYTDTERGHQEAACVAEETVGQQTCTRERAATQREQRQGSTQGRWQAKVGQ
eukprot:6078146-Amphidinium_carterae.1